MATQEVVYKIKADNNQAVQAFNDLSKAQGRVEQTTKKLGSATNQGNMMLMSTSRIIQDMPFGFMAVGNNITFLAEQFAYAKTQGMGFKDSLKGIFTSLMGTGGIIFAISTAVSVLTMLSMNTGKTKGEVKGLTEALKENWSEAYKARKEWERFREELKKFTAADLGESLKSLNKQIEEFNISVFTGMLAYLGLYDGLISKINEINTLTTQKNMVLSQFITTTYDPDKTIDRVKELLKVQKEITQEIIKMGRAGDATNRFRLGGDATRRGLAGAGGLSTGFGTGGISPLTSGMAGGAGITEGFAKQMAFINSQIRESASLLSSEFKTAWQDIFGEANSLFEKFMLNIASSLAELATQNLLSGFLNMILPGAGGLAAMATGSTKNPSIINLQVENRTLASFYVNGKNEATRLRMD